MVRALVFVVPALALAGCSSGVVPPATPSAVPFAPARVAAATGLESVMRHNAAALQSMFGKPDLDVREGIARKLQYSSPACVLDAYLYPSSAGGEPTVTHVDARLPDGRDMDRASCVAAIVADRKTARQ